MKFKHWLLAVEQTYPTNEGRMRNLLATGALASCGVFGCQRPNDAAPAPENPGAPPLVQRAGDETKVTVERPRANTWEFNFQGGIPPSRAIAQAKQMVMKEIGAESEEGIAADFDKTPGGVSVTIMFSRPQDRPGASRPVIVDD